MLIIRSEPSDLVEGFGESHRAQGVFEEPQTRHDEKCDLKVRKYPYLPTHHGNWDKNGPFVHESSMIRIGYAHYIQILRALLVIPGSAT